MAKKYQSDVVNNLILGMVTMPRGYCLNRRGVSQQFAVRFEKIAKQSLFNKLANLQGIVFAALGGIEKALARRPRSLSSQTIS